MPLEHELSAEQLIPLHVGSIFEFIKYRKMRLPYIYWVLGGPTILKHEEIPKKWLWARTESSFAIRSPEIKSTTHCFLGTVIEVVPKGWADLRLGFNDRKKHALADCKKIPLFCGTKETRQFKRPFSIDTLFRQSGVYD